MSTVVLGSVVFTLLILLLSVLVLQVRRILLPSTPVNVTVNNKQTIAAHTGESLLTILSNASISIPSACAGVGTCGLCRVIVTKGGGSVLTTEASRLSVTDQQQGVRLACQVIARNDLSIKLPASILSADHWQCDVISTRNLSPLIKEIILRIPPNSLVEFRPGAFVQITAPPFKLSFGDINIDDPHTQSWNRLQLSRMQLNSKEDVLRAYSIANRPQDAGLLVLVIRLALPPPSSGFNLPPGIVSSWLFSLKKGDNVNVSGPYGEFGARNNSRDMILIGGGVGMAPLRSIIHHELHAGSVRNVRFFYGARSSEDLFYIDEFNALADQFENFQLTVALSDPVEQESWQGLRGFIHEIVYQQHICIHPHPEDCDYYLCGPPLMQAAMESTLDDAGVDKDCIFADDFGA